MRFLPVGECRHRRLIDIPFGSVSRSQTQAHSAHTSFSGGELPCWFTRSPRACCALLLCSCLWSLSCPPPFSLNTRLPTWCRTFPAEASLSIQTLSTRGVLRSHLPVLTGSATTGL